MKRSFLFALLLVLVCTGCATGFGRSYFGFEADISTAPPPPAIVLDREPDMVLVPGTGVYEADADLGYDMFRYGSAWYVSYQGYWYAAPSYRGPFRIVRADRVPRRIYDVPVERWRHHPGDRGEHRGHDHGDHDRDDGHRDRD